MARGRAGLGLGGALAALGLGMLGGPAIAKVDCGVGRGLGLPVAAQLAAARPSATPGAAAPGRPGATAPRAAGPTRPAAPQQPGGRPSPAAARARAQGRPNAAAVEGPAAQALWPRHPRARRVAKRLGGEGVTIWFSPDKPQEVFAYYQRVLGQAGWAISPDAVALAREGLSLGEPAWLAFERPGMGKLELTVVPAKDPQTGRMGTVFYQEAKLKP